MNLLRCYSNFFRTTINMPLKRRTHPPLLLSPSEVGRALVISELRIANWRTGKTRSFAANCR